MKFVKIQKELLDRFGVDPELMVKEDRPCVLVVKLTYKSKLYDLAIPFRSNIPPATPKNEYFAFPPRPATKPRHHHGLHYIKMFPVEKKYFVYYRTDNEFSRLLLSIIDKNEKRIVTECQNYLAEYEKGHIPRYATHLDELIALL